MQIVIDNLWVLFSAILVIMMQAGFALLEAGSTRMKNAGHVASKQILTIGIALIAFWVCGYGLTFGEGKWIGTNGWFLNLAQSGDLKNEVSFFFQFSFLAVSLAIVWGGFAERAKLSVYLIFGLLYCVVIYPVVGHWVWGGGWLHDLGKQDFAGSTVVHLQGAIAAFVATILLKPRLGKFNSDGSANSLLGHNQVYSVLGVLIIWIGWFGFNAGSTLTVKDGFYTYVALTTHLAAAAGIFGAMGMSRILTGKISFGSILNGVLAALVAITASCAFVKPWAAVLIGFIAGVVAIYTGWWIEKRRIDDPISAASVHGIAGIWGTLSTGLFAAPDLVRKVGVGKSGLLYGGGFQQLGVQTLGIVVTISYVTIASFLILWALKKTIGIRVSKENEQQGLDVSEHGVYGYAEHFVMKVSRQKKEVS
ncbi:ammonium transporter [Seinonella peptonophila]|uniref:Ammonium transporter n=1 Tax=Seinonella peptonophila TaxID=112248 RepID=A0A1M4T0Y1_9BACL|nr:ammonium transporter [Seinonella peptonophila]SHE38141.1 ammonium transporter [Seinonella peptonophila]